MGCNTVVIISSGLHVDDVVGGRDMVGLSVPSAVSQVHDELTGSLAISELLEELLGQTVSVVCTVVVKI